MSTELFPGLCVCRKRPECSITSFHYIQLPHRKTFILAKESSKWLLSCCWVHTLWVSAVLPVLRLPLVDTASGTKRKWNIPCDAESTWGCWGNTILGRQDLFYFMFETKIGDTQKLGDSASLSPPWLWVCLAAYTIFIEHDRFNHELEQEK